MARVNKAAIRDEYRVMARAAKLERKWNQDLEEAQANGTHSPPVPGGEVFDMLKLPEGQRKVAAKRLFDRLEKGMAILYDRWQDEKEYEGWADYAVSMSDALQKYEPRAHFIRSSQKPFGFTYQLGGTYYQISVTATKYAYKVVDYL